MTLIKVTGFVGGSVVIRCPYEQGNEVNSKYLCRGSCTLWKDIPVRKREGQTKAIAGRFSLHDDTMTTVLTVTITGLTEHDFGLYWCVTERGTEASNYYTKVMLEVLPGVYHFIDLLIY